MAQRTTEDELRGLRSLDDGRPFWEHAEEAGYEPSRWRESKAALLGLDAWLELHIEQGRVLQDAGRRLGIVDAITGFVQGDLVIRGRADHAGATPMDARLDPGPVAGACLLELERLARGAPVRTVGTIGEIDVRPGLISAIPESVRLSLDVRSVDAGAMHGVAERIVHFATDAAARRGMVATSSARQVVEPTPLDIAVVEALEAAAKGAAVPHLRMASHALHDTALLAPHVPSAMVFIPCVDGISHAPDESASPDDAALAVEVMLNALLGLR